MVMKTVITVGQICGTITRKKTWPLVGAVDPGRFEGVVGDAT